MSWKPFTLPAAVLVVLCVSAVRAETCVHAERDVASPIECLDVLRLSFTSPDPAKRLVSASFDVTTASLAGISFAAWGTPCGWIEPSEITAHGGEGTQVLTVDFANFVPGATIVMQLDLDQGAAGGTPLASEFLGSTVTASFQDGEVVVATFDVPQNTLVIHADSCPTAEPTCLESERGVGLADTPGSGECGDYLTLEFTSSEMGRELASVEFDFSTASLGTIFLDGWGSPCGWLQPAGVTGLSGAGTQTPGASFSGLTAGVRLVLQADLDRDAATGGTPTAAELDGALVTGIFTDGEVITAVYDDAVDAFTVVADSCGPLQLRPDLELLLLGDLLHLQIILANAVLGELIDRDTASSVLKRVRDVEAALVEIDPKASFDERVGTTTALAVALESLGSLVEEAIGKGVVEKTTAGLLRDQLTRLDAGLARVPNLVLREVCDGLDNDGDGSIDEDFDADRDGIPDCRDNCPGVGNPEQADADRNGIGDACQTATLRESCDAADNDDDGAVDEGFDTDRDGVADCLDNCPGIPNPRQGDRDRDGTGDACEDAVEFPDRHGFVRGDVNADSLLDITDPINSLNYQFLGEIEIECLKSADYNDDGTIDITDPIAQLDRMFLGTFKPRPPHRSCGLDPTPDTLDCRVPTCLVGGSPCLPTADIVLHVDGSYPAGGNGSPAAPFQTLQEAVLASSAGVDILVRPGVYQETLTLPRGVNLLGVLANGQVPTIDGGSATGPVIMAAGDNRICGFTIEGGRGGIEFDISVTLALAPQNPGGGPETTSRVSDCQIRNTRTAVRIVTAEDLDLGTERKEALFELHHNWIHDLLLSESGIFSTLNGPVSGDLQFGFDIRDSVIHDTNQGIVLRAYGPRASISGRVQNNLVFRSHTHGLVLDGTSGGNVGLLISNNTISQSGGIMPFFNPGHGILAISDLAPSGFGSVHVSLTNNIIVNSAGSGFEESGTLSDATEVSHNLFWGNADGPYYDEDTVSTINTEADLNNPSVVPGSVEFWSGSGNRIVPPLFATGLYRFVDANTPLAVPAAGYFLSDSLPAVSPAVDAGNATSAAHDLDALTTSPSGTPDSGTVDMGYHYRPGP